MRSLPDMPAWGPHSWEARDRHVPCIFSEKKELSGKREVKSRIKDRWGGKLEGRNREGEEEGEEQGGRLVHVHTADMLISK